MICLSNMPEKITASFVTNMLNISQATGPGFYRCYSFSKQDPMRYSEQDFETIYRATYPILSKYVFRKTSRLEDGQDLLQDLYYALYKHMMKVNEPIDNPQAYLIRMADNALSHYYRAKSKSDVTLRNDDEDGLEMIPDDFELELNVLDHVSLEQIWSEIEKIGEPDRSILIARYRFDMNYPEISDQFELPETTIKSKVYKALEKLKSKFTK